MAGSKRRGSDRQHSERPQPVDIRPTGEVVVVGRPIQVVVCIRGCHVPQWTLFDASNTPIRNDEDL